MSIWEIAKGKFVIVEDIQGKFMLFFEEKIRCERIVFKLQKMQDGYYIAREMKLLILCIICQMSSTFSPKCGVGCITIEHTNKGEITLSWGIV